MSLRSGWSPPQVNLNIISGRGGLGDSIARLPAFRYMHDTYKHVSAIIYVQDGWLDLIKYLLPETERRKYKKLSEAPWELKKPYVEFDENRLTTLHLHLTDHAFLILMDMLPPTRADKAYPRAPRTELASVAADTLKLLATSDPRMVIFTTDYTAPSRQWLSVHANRLAMMCAERGLTPVLLGSTQPIKTGVENDDIIPRQNDGLRPDLFLDLRGKTTLIEALGVIQRARAVVGVDNGLLHLAHCTDTPVVMGFSTLSPAHRVPVRFLKTPLPGCHDAGRGAALTEVVEAKVPCAGCQSRGFAINTDWRECVMPDHQYACLLTLTADRFWDKLKKLGVV